MRATIRIVGLSVAVLLVSCKKSGELDRKEAASVISQNLLNSPVSQVREQPSAHVDGMAEGLWDNSGQMAVDADRSISGRRNGYLILGTPLQRTVTQVTGIASPVSALAIESTSMKEVQFEWSYVGVQGLLKRMAAQGGTGVAILRKFDDGWRIAEIKTTDNDRPFVLTAADTLQRDSVRKEIAKGRAEEQAIFDIESKREGEDAAMEELRQIARKSTKVLSTYKVLVSNSGNSVEGTLVLSDVAYHINDGGFFFVNFIGVEPVASEIISDGKIAAYTVMLTEEYGLAAFAIKSDRDRFLGQLKQAMSEWRAKYPTLK